MGPIAGVSTTLLLASAGVFGLMFWRKRNTGQAAMLQLQASSAPTLAPWMDQQASATNNYYAQATVATTAQNQPMLPFAMQSITQYSPLLGALDSSQRDAPGSPPASDLRPLSIDYPQLLEVHTDKTPVTMSPSTLQPRSATEDANLQPALQLASTQFSPPQAASEAHIPATVAQTPIPSLQQNTPIAFEFPPHDSLLENLMHQAQMGIFSLPDKTG
jgi:hypothetical protein